MTTLTHADDGFDSKCADETALRMLIVRGRDQAIERCVESIAKGEAAPGGAAFWQLVKTNIEARS